MLAVDVRQAHVAALIGIRQLRVIKADQTQEATQNNAVTAGGAGIFILIAIIVIVLALASSRKKNDQNGDPNATMQGRTGSTTGSNFSSLVGGSKTGGGRTAVGK